MAYVVTLTIDCMTVSKTNRAFKKPLVIVLLGPTASGKTSLAIELAEQLKLNVINVDSRQIYKGMNIGTAKPSLEEQNRVKHHLIDIRCPDEPMTLYEFQQLANELIEKELNDPGIAFLVGGSGLYLKGITQGLCPPSVPPQPFIREQFESLGQIICHPLLALADPTAANRIAPADSVRTFRSLEVLYATGKKPSRQQQIHPPNWQILELGLNPKDLNKKIAYRTSNMYSNGLLEETEKLKKQYGLALPLLQTIGYGEALQVLEGQLKITEAIQLTTRRTQKFAKRQRTWFRRQHNAHWLQSDEALSEALSLIQTVLI